MHRSACKRLNLDWLESLDVLHSCGQFSLAAKKLGISQSALSQRIAKIEESIGLPLVVRHSPVHLTPSGHRLIVYSQRARHLMLSTNEELRCLLDMTSMGNTDVEAT
jgi:DNA-binding transcriptional LysR family regulator